MDSKEMINAVVPSPRERSQIGLNADFMYIFAGENSPTTLTKWTVYPLQNCPTSTVWCFNLLANTWEPRIEIKNAQTGKYHMGSQYCVTPPTCAVDLPEFLYWDNHNNIFKLEQQEQENQIVSIFLPRVDVDGSYEEELTEISTEFGSNIHSLDNHHFYFLRVQNMHASFYEDDEASFADPRYLRSSLEVYEFAFKNERWEWQCVSRNRQYKGHFSGGGKPDRSKVIQHHVDEEESVRHAVIRHEERPEEEFRQVRPRQLESEEQVHGLVRAWNERRRFETEEPFYEDVIDFLKSIQGALFFANGQNPDVDEWSDNEEQEDEE